MISLKKKVQGNNLIIEMSGRIGGEASIEMFRQIKEMLEGHQEENLVLDFENLEFIDSSGLGSLVAVNSTLLKQQRTLTLASVPDNLLELLKITNLDRVLRIVPAVENAI